MREKLVWAGLKCGVAAEKTPLPVSVWEEHCRSPPPCNTWALDCISHYVKNEIILIWELTQSHSKGSASWLISYHG